MEKKNPQEKLKTVSLGLHKETLRRLDDSQIKGVAGGGRIRVPVGHADDTTPIYDETGD